jgi:hypothetical protein
MTNKQNNQKPPITDLWLLVDEEQTLRFGMRQSWRWAEAQQPARRQVREAETAQECCAV